MVLSDRFEEDRNVDDQPAASAARELKAAARDVMRLGSQWAHSALNWVDERRNTMSNRDRDDRDFQERQAMQGQRNPGQRYGQQDASARQRERERAAQGRDRDIQGNFSSGGRSGQSSFSGGGQEGSWRESSGYGGQRYEGERYEGQEYEGIGNAQADRFGASRQTRYGQDMGSSGYGQQRGYGSSEPWPESSGAESQRGGGQRPYGSQAYGSEQGSGLSSQSQRYAGQGYGTQGYEGQGYETPAYGQPYGSQSGYGLGEAQQAYGRQSQEQGRASKGGYRGMGPKNYSRSDERIREDLNERLTDADEIDASGLNVEVSQGIVTLSGTVEQRWMKHRAEDLAESCSGVRDVHNQIRVQQPLGQQSSGDGSYGKGASSTGSQSKSSAGSAGSSASSGSSTTPSASGSASLSGGSGSAGSTSASGGTSSNRTGGTTGSGH
jgi:osmotically-inducible protein OsmY